MYRCRTTKRRKVDHCYRDPQICSPSPRDTVGYISQNGSTVIHRNPLCEAGLSRIMKIFLTFLHDDLHNPVWCCVEKQTEKYLADDLSWSTVTAVAEESINASETDLVEQD